MIFFPYDIVLAPAGSGYSIIEDEYWNNDEELAQKDKLWMLTNQT